MRSLFLWGYAQKNTNGYVWREGFAEWMPISQIDELSSSAREISGPPSSARNTADEIDFKIMGSEMQFVEVDLDPGESAMAEAGAMMYKDSSIVMETVFGDASGASQGGGFMDKLLGAGKRLLTGESLFMSGRENAAGVSAKGRRKGRRLHPGIAGRFF
jgi:hypothetical protein